MAKRQSTGRGGSTKGWKRAGVPPLGMVEARNHLSEVFRRSVLHLCYSYGMARTRISTTVDAELLASARRVRSGLSDSALIDEALASLLARQRAAEIDAAYAAYDEHPLDEQDEWGDLASFRTAAGAS